MNATAPFRLTIIVAALGLTAGQAARAQSAPCTTFQTAVLAQISTAGDSAKVEPDRACVDIGGRIDWTALDGESWSTDFPDDAHSPFKPNRRHHAATVHHKRGDRVRACTKADPRYDATAGGCIFKYKATHVKNGKSSGVDPDVVIKPGT